MNNVRQHDYPDPSQVVTVPVQPESAAFHQSANFPGQGHSLLDGLAMEVDGARGRQPDIDWQFYFDTLSPNLSPNLDDLATYLEISSDEVDRIKKEYRPENEKCFHVLWTWRKKASGENDAVKLTQLHKALKEAGRNDLAERSIPTRNEYEYKQYVHDQEKRVEKGKEALKVAKRAGVDSVRLGRYFGLNEDDIARIVSNNADDSVKQGREILEACIKNNLLTTHLHLCHGLNYIDNRSLIKDMNDNWK